MEMKSARHRNEDARDGTAVELIVERGSHPRKRKWKEREVALLGRMADAKVARRLRIDPLTVLYERRRRGIAAFQPRRPDTVWTARMLARLGRDTDRAVGAELGLSESVVQRKRQLLGIPTFAGKGGQKTTRHWTPRELALLGTASDPRIAKRLRISVPAVARKRWLLGIAPFQPAPPRFRWTRRGLALLGRYRDPEVARRLGTSVMLVRTKRRVLGIAPFDGDRARWVVRKPELREIARLPVAEACAKFGLSNKTVAKIRAEHGLGLRRWQATEERLLGSGPDRDVAARLGRSLNGVRSRRYKLGIPIHRGRGGGGAGRVR